MMPQSAPAPRLCGTCDGFPVVAVTTDTRRRDGSRVTRRLSCPACKGTGHTTPASRRRAVTGA
ncbi:hypothetical protein SUDANB145_02022 [Streptomyces sp. enrichment culture]|uniref:hypothetical protein n=1 Tax=Streptomyces sp. enrichment culture TaxID=1795815 RepID=UPI003F5522C4